MAKRKTTETGKSRSPARRATPKTTGSRPSKASAKPSRAGGAAQKAGRSSNGTIVSKTAKAKIIKQAAGLRPGEPGADRRPVPVVPSGNGDKHENHEPEERPVLTTLSDAELEEFRELLLAKRRELIGDMHHLTNEAMRQGSSGEASGVSSMPIHMADIGSDTWEQELTLGLIENEKNLLREIDDAIKRIDDRTYGV